MSIPKNVSKSTIVRNPHLYGAGEAVHLGNPEAAAARDVVKLLTKKKRARKSIEDRLNKTEKRWLEELKRRNLKVIKPFGVTLLLANGVRYTPDFYTREVGVDSAVFYEVKGPYVRPDAWTKLKLAASLFPEFSFIMAQWQNGQWTETIVEP